MKLLKVLALGAAIALSAASGAAARDRLTFAYLSDPSQEVILWALKNGKVESETLDVEVAALDIPALLQATPARTYDVITTAAMAIPRALERGLNLRIISTGLRSSKEGRGGSVWVRPDSPIKSAAELKGKKLAVLSIPSAGATLMRISLAKAHGLDVSIPGGDIEFVEVPAVAMPGALATGRVDAAALSHMQAFQATQSGDFKPVVEAERDLYAATKLQSVSAVIVGYEDKLDANPERYLEFLRMLGASRDYALANSEAVFTEVAKKYEVDPRYFSTWFEDYFEYPVELTEIDKAAISMLWHEAVALGLMAKAPSVDDAVWTGLKAR